jgi:uncharacterized ion transporter superfamily protein YfcC
VRLPHPSVLLLGGTLLAALLTWVLPAGEFDRRTDDSTGRRVAVAGTYHRVAAAPVGAFAAAVAVPRGFVEASDVVAVVIFVGGAWIIVDRLGTLGAVVAALVAAFRNRGLWAIPIISAFFAIMGALENMEEEIIPLIPGLLLLGAGLGIDPVAVVAMSAGAAMVGSAFGPTNPFQAGIAMKLAQVPPLEGGLLRLGMFVVAVVAWVVFTMRFAQRTRTAVPAAPALDKERLDARHALVLASVLLPMTIYVYGALRLGWGFNELSAAFFLGGLSAGLLGRLGLARSLTTYLEGMQMLLPAAFMVGLARSISLVLEQGRVVDSILNGFASSLGRVPAVVSAFLMVPFHAIIHVAVPSVSGQAVLTMPLLAPLADLLGLSRQVPVLAFQAGAGLMELVTPTNGALMAILLAAGVSYERWIRFTLAAILIPLLVGLSGIAVAVFLGL